MARKDSAPSSTPKKPGRVAQIRQVYTAAHAVDPDDRLVDGARRPRRRRRSSWSSASSSATGSTSCVLSIPLAALAAAFVLSRRAESAAYRSIEGQPGAAGAALSALRRGWYYDQQPVAAEAQRAGDMSSAAMVFRAVGRPGVVLLGRGPRRPRHPAGRGRAQEGRPRRPRRAGQRRPRRRGRRGRRARCARSRAR